MKIIDAHVHLVETVAGIGAEGELRFTGGGFARYATGRTFRLLPQRFATGRVTPEDVLALMDENGVEKAVLLQGNYLGFQNLYSFEAQRKYPDRFKAAASYDPFSRMKEDIRRHLFEELGISVVKFELSTGSGLMCNHGAFPLDGEMMEAEYRYAQEHGLICVLDIGRPGTASFQVEALRRAILHHPGLRFVICHLLAPDRDAEEAMKAGLARLTLPNVWFDLAALPHNVRPEEYPYETAQRFVLRAAEIAGADRLMFGSDLPTTLKEDTYDHLIGFVRDASGLEAATRRMILRENADRLYFGA